MHLILFVDERDGLHFCGKRLSSDKVLTDYILQYTKSSKLWMNAYSASLFAADHVCIDETFLDKASDEDYCLLENIQLPPNIEPKSILLCYWNRHYPSTAKFDRSLLEDMHLESVVDFPGNSHDRISVERYIL